MNVLAFNLKPELIELKLRPESYKLATGGCVDSITIVENDGNGWTWDLNGIAVAHEEPVILMSSIHSYESPDGALYAATKYWADLPSWPGFPTEKKVKVDAKQLQTLVSKLCCYCAPELHDEAVLFLRENGIEPVTPTAA